MRSFLRTVRFVVTDTFRSRKGAVAQPKHRRDFYRNATGLRGGLGRGSAERIDYHSERGLRPDEDA